MFVSDGCFRYWPLLPELSPLSHRAAARGTLAHAFLDVFEQEPLPADSPLWDAPNLALTPHASASNSEYLDLWFTELAPHLDALT